MWRNKYTVLAITGLLFNLLETWLFGWHWHAQSGAEAFCDSISILLIGWGVIGDIATNLHIHKHYKNITNINTQKVEFKDEPKIMSYNVGIKHDLKAKADR